MIFGKEGGGNRTMGSALLIAGSCIGIGTLGLPVSTASGGFLPSLLMFIVSWLFMMSTGLLLLEVNLAFKRDVNLITMAEKTLGAVGKGATWLLFLFLFYSIMVAYSAGSGELVADFFEESFSLPLPKWAGSIGFIATLGVIIYFGAFAVDRVNRLLMVGLIVTYLLLVVVGIPHVESSFLDRVDWGKSLFAIPVMIISFGFHNLVPSLTTYLDFDKRAMRKAIIIGSAIPLVGYLLWEWIVLGVIPQEEFAKALEQGNMVTHTFKVVVGKAWIVHIIEYFAFFAIVTSFIGVALSFVDFLADGLSIEKDRFGKIGITFLALAPPLFFSLVYPSIFIEALNFAGGFGAVILFGVLPAAMAWVGRYKMMLWEERLLPGGRASLICIALFGGAVFLMQLFNAVVL